MVLSAFCELVELGTHDELVGAGGLYAGLWASWHGGHDDQDPNASQA